MAINKVVLAKQIDGKIEYLYPKTTSDMVMFTDNMTIEDRVNDVDSNKMDKPVDEYGYPIDGYEGQILKSNGDGTSSWIDYIPAGASTITLYRDPSKWHYYEYNGEELYGQVVEVTNYNITENSKVDLQLSASRAVKYKDLNLSFVAETITGRFTSPVTGETTSSTHVIVFSIGDIPDFEEDQIIQVTVMEVE